MYRHRRTFPDKRRGSGESTYAAGTRPRRVVINAEHSRRENPRFPVTHQEGDLQARYDDVDGVRGDMGNGSGNGNSARSWTTPAVASGGLTESVRRPPHSAISCRKRCAASGSPAR